MKIQLFLFTGIILSFLVILLIYISNRFSTEEHVSGIKSEYSLLFSEERRSVFGLASEQRFVNADVSRSIRTTSPYAYLKVELLNETETAADVILYNTSWNYYIEMLSPERDAAVTLYRYGDRVPFGDSPYRHIKPGFPVTVPAGSRLTFILEYFSPSSIVIAPGIISFQSYLDAAVSERTVAGFFCGVFMILILINTVNGFLLNGLDFFPAVAFMLSLFFFFLRQSRILLLLIDPMVYPDWLFAFSIGLNIITSINLARSLMKEYFCRKLGLLLIVIISVSAGLMIYSFFGAPYLAADLLNLLVPAVVVLIGVGVFRSLKAGDYDMLYIVLVFIPWLTTMAVDITASANNLRLQISPAILQVAGMILSLVLFSIVLQFYNNRRFRKYLLSVDVRRESDQIEMDQKLVEVAELKSAVLHQLGYRLIQPIDSIIALSAIIRREEKPAEVSAVLSEISSEAEDLKQMIKSDIEVLVNELDEESVETGLHEKFSNAIEPETKPWIDTSICIYDINPENSARTALLLRSTGYDVRVISEHYQILSLVNAGRIDVLIIDPVATGENAFNLCRMIREEHNMFEVPVLMVANYHADYLMKKGYGAGVNDFLTRPFDSSELAARIQSLVKLKNVARHNHDLAKSEKEKNTFLYFLTHNINTPLTLLLNRIRDLSLSAEPDSFREVSDDLHAASREINEIVQNVLISFRLSDGRQTLRFSRFRIEDVVRAVADDLSRKVAEKNQSLEIKSETVPMIDADYSAMRGVLYNLIDNGLKFSPTGSCVSIRISYSEKVRVEVEDAGPGIAPSEQGLLFERFQCLSTHPTGGESSTGLGLYVAHELTRMNGGELYYRDGDDGACFVVSLPAAVNNGNE
ncbi:MAG: ATP-binding protein [Spirochaetales bacterium]|uniref:histidine kinase n=1 Tax=Candidatus Thalassospirochaeta sargassi TaxID=3119039 RepID=A0AAJ1IGW9_9SPIO|nr:ATP-binding protein [Spirochaetales bacterium]